MTDHPVDPSTDLVLERTVAASPERLYRAWVDPEQLKQWFCPRPWRVVEVVIDLRPGGLFRFVMEGPEGDRSENTGCWLEVIPNRRLTWTAVLGPGFRPQSTWMPMTAEINFIPEGGGTRYLAVARHPDTETAKKHEEMGFHEGWGTTLDQLLELVG